MDKSEVSIPKQQRSIEKKEKILKAGYEIFCEKGYHNTNTVEIAKRAGVATGSVYRYYKDKKSIFLDVLNLYSNEIMSRIYQLLENLAPDADLKSLLQNVIEASVQSHTVTKEVHEEMTAMSHQDKDVAYFFSKLRDTLVNHLVNLLEQHGFHTVHTKEKVILTYNIIEDICHEIVYSKQETLNYEVMISEAIDMIIYLLTKEGTSG
ncbi:MAG: hypothetical protein ACFWTJ_15310 [Lachnoclostridium sp.]